MFIEHATKVRLGFCVSETASGGQHLVPKIVPMPKRAGKRSDGRFAPGEFPALPLPDPDEESSSVTKVNRWIALADIALGQGIGRKMA